MVKEKKLQRMKLRQFHRLSYLYMGVCLSSRYHSMSSMSSFISCVLILHGRYTVSPIKASIDNRGTEIEKHKAHINQRAQRGVEVVRMSISLSHLYCFERKQCFTSETQIYEIQVCMSFPISRFRIVFGIKKSSISLSLALCLLQFEYFVT